MKTEPESVERLRAKAALERGRHFFNTDRYDDALAAFEASITADPTFLRAYTAKAHALTMLGRPDAAVTVCEGIIARDAAYALSYSTMGSALHKLGRVAEAQAAYEKAVTLDADEPLVHYNFACFWAGQENADKCREYLARTLQLDPRQNAKAATDGDFARFRDEGWFQELVAFK